MRNNHFILASAAITGTGLFTASCSNEPSKKDIDRPNIVWIVCEDMNPILGCYGDQLAKTPNIDRLARIGIVYRHAYANAPISSPARS